MADLLDYHKQVSDALQERQSWLEKTELPKLKDEFRTFHTAFYSLYTLFLKKRIIDEDPYKQDIKVVDIAVPDTSVFPETERVAQLTVRLSQYDNQLDYLVNFFQFSLETLGLDIIKRILGLLRYIDWGHFVMDSNTAPNTKAMIEFIALAKNGADPLSMSIINEAMSNLHKSTGIILGFLKIVTDFNRETYKMEVRTKVTAGMQSADAVQLGQIKKKFAAVMVKKPFFPDLIEEIIKEDYSKDNAKFREQTLKKLAIPDAKPKVTKPQISFKAFLIEGLLALGGVASTLAEIAPKMDENSEVLENQRKGFWDKLKKLMQQMMNHEPEPPIYEVEYLDTTRGVQVKESVNFRNLRNDIDHKAKLLQNISSRNLSKLESMEEAQLLGILERNIREVQSLHKILSALDDFFKAAVDKEDRDKIKGIKPDLGAIKNAIVKANQKRYEYSAQKEEEEQFKRLGINSDT